MARRKKVISSLDMFRKEPEVVTLDGTTIKAGDMIKINGEHGKRFQFKNFVTNINTEATWIDCYEMEKGLHALALHTYTPEEWAALGKAPDSPACQHKREV